MIISSNTQIRRITIALIAFVVLITLLSYSLGIIVISQDLDSGIVEKIFKLFNVDFERNFPTWVSSSFLFFAGVCFLIVAFYRQKLKLRYFTHWLVLGLMFFGMSLDEFVQIHEQVITPLRSAFHATGFLYFTWIVPVAAVTLVVGFVYLKFILSLIWETKVVFILAAFLYVAGALGMEAIGGKYMDAVRLQSGQYDYIYLSLTHIEELMELLGIVLFIHVGMRYIQLMGSAKSEFVNNEEN